MTTVYVQFHLQVVALRNVLERDLTRAKFVMAITLAAAGILCFLAVTSGDPAREFYAPLAALSASVALVFAVIGARTAGTLRRTRVTEQVAASLALEPPLEGEVTLP